MYLQPYLYQHKHFVFLMLLSLPVSSVLTGCHTKNHHNPANAPVSATVITQIALSKNQLKQLDISQSVLHTFRPSQIVTGQLNYDLNQTTPVFSNYAGKIYRCYALLGKSVHRGDPLYSLLSPDLVQAVASLRSSYSTLELSRKTLTRTEGMLQTGALAVKDLEQAQADLTSATAAYTAARSTLQQVMGMTKNQIEAFLGAKPSPSNLILIIRSPIDGEVTDRQAEEGLLVQPGNNPPPYTVSNINKLWLEFNVPEVESTQIKIGAAYNAQLTAMPGLNLKGRISEVARAIDPATHTLTVRTQINNMQHQLHPGMLAVAHLQSSSSYTATAVPVKSVVHEPDGSTSVWLSLDHRHFQEQTVQTGLEQDGWVEIRQGLSNGVPIVSTGAINLSAMRNASGDGDD